MHAVVVFPVRGDDILLGIKTEKIGVGRWNGPGGKIEKGETPEQTAVRELPEETTLETTAAALEKIALVDFHNQRADGSTFLARVHMFLALAISGVATDTRELVKQTWFNRNNLPYWQMMPADREWLPPALAGKKVRATAWYGPEQRVLLRKTEIHIVKNLD